MTDDLALIRALKSGDSNALADLFETYADRIYRLAMGSLQNPDEAEDVVQETFIKLISNIEKFEGRSNLGTWLYRVAYNASMDRFRKPNETGLPSGKPEYEDGNFTPITWMKSCAQMRKSTWPAVKTAAWRWTQPSK